MTLKILLSLGNGITDLCIGAAAMLAASEDAVRWAASRGFSIMMDPHSPHGEIARKRELYRSALEAAGFAFAGGELPMARLLATPGDLRSDAGREVELKRLAGPHRVYALDWR